MSTGKGDAPRPRLVSREEYAANYDRAFRRRDRVASEMTRLDPNRGTGRTTRMLEDVVAAAPASPRIIVVVGCSPEISIYIHMLAKMADLKGMTIKRIGPCDVRLSGCRVTFAVNRPDLDGQLCGLPTDTPKFYDHACWRRR